MIFFLVLISLGVGYFAILIHPEKKYKINSLEGQHLYLSAALYGLFSLLIAVIILPFILLLIGLDSCDSILQPDKNIFNNYMDCVYRGDDDFKKQMFYSFSMTVCSFFSAYMITVYVYIRRYLRNTVALFKKLVLYAENEFYRCLFRSYVYKYIYDCLNVSSGFYDLKRRLSSFISSITQFISDIFDEIVSPDEIFLNKLYSRSPRNVMLYDSIKGDADYLMLTLRDRKVYVGIVVYGGDPSSIADSHSEILIIPILSGYRDRNTLEVNFTTHYSKIDKHKDQEIYLSIPVDSILTTTPFYPKVYDKFMEQRKEDYASRLDGKFKLISPYLLPDFSFKRQQSVNWKSDSVSKIPE